MIIIVRLRETLEIQLWKSWRTVERQLKHSSEEVKRWLKHNFYWEIVEKEFRHSWEIAKTKLRHNDLILLPPTLLLSLPTTLSFSLLSPFPLIFSYSHYLQLPPFSLYLSPFWFLTLHFLSPHPHHIFIPIIFISYSEYHSIYLKDFLTLLTHSSCVTVNTCHINISLKTELTKVKAYHTKMKFI